MQINSLSESPICSFLSLTSLSGFSQNSHHLSSLGLVPFLCMTFISATSSHFHVCRHTCIKYYSFPASHGRHRCVSLHFSLWEAFFWYDFISFSFYIFTYSRVLLSLFISHVSSWDLLSLSLTLHTCLVTLSDMHSTPSRSLGTALCFISYPLSLHHMRVISVSHLPFLFPSPLVTATFLSPTRSSFRLPFHTLLSSTHLER